MKTKNLSLVIGSALLGTLAIGACNIPEPAAPCLIGRQDFGVPYIVHYTKTSSGPDCRNYAAASAGMTTDCGPYVCTGAPGNDPYPMDNSFETWAMVKFGPPNGTVKDLAILPITFTGLQTSSRDIAPYDTNPSHSQLMKGALDGFTVDSNGYCSVASLATAEQDIGGPGFTALNGPDNSGAGTPIKYTVTNMKFLADPAHQGSQFGATLNYVDGACSATYAVIGIHPTAGCNTDADCSAKPNVDAGFGGSGLQPDMPVKCNTTDPFVTNWAQNAIGTNGLCVLSGSFPQLCNNCNTL